MNWFRKTVFSPRFWLGLPKFSHTPSELSVTVVIPAWNEAETITATVESLKVQTYKHKLIIVNDRSTDDTSAIAHYLSNKYAGLYDIQVVDVEEKAGSKSQALNKAIPYIESDIFVCVDADTELDKDSLARLMRAFNNPNVQVASGFVVSKHDDNFWQMARRGEYIVGQAITKSAQENLNAVLVASGCFFAIRSDLLREHGFDHSTMAEDMDLTWTAVEAGGDVAFVQDAFCYVTDPHNWQLYDKQLYRWYAGLFQCIKKRRYDLFSRNPKLGFAVYFYTLSSLIGVPVWIAFIIWMAAVSPGGLIVFTIFMYLLLLVPAYFHGVWNGYDVRRYPTYVAATMIGGFVNYTIFVRAAINELVLNNTLKVWVKGH
jgi:cellulose synthase/poly-beta-1,6-N-acetylglucosamine synthase-like glycosyltransferase